MSTLQERLEEVMAATGWDHQALMRVSRQSSSVVSQWLGKSTKLIKTIGKLEAAIYIERASGFSALWVAKGMGPKMVPSPKQAPPLHVVSATPLVAEPAPAYADPAAVLEQMGLLLASVPPSNRAAMADVLAGWAKDGGADDRRHVLLALLSPIQKQHPAA